MIQMIIHNRKSEEATEINNQGVGSQLAYLIEGYEDVSAAELHILDTLDYAKELRSEFGQKLPYYSETLRTVVKEASRGY